MSAGRWLDPNLARAPFENDRPVVRVAWALWVLALLAAGAAAWMYAGARQDASSRRSEWVRATAEAASARSRSATLRAALEGEDLAGRNQRTEFLNQRIAERAFSWNGLFDHLTSLMPRGVRLQNLAPEGFALQRGPRNAAASSPATTKVTMRLRGEAEETESLLEFVDRLYAHPAFANPNLARESAQKDLRIQFDLTVEYLPGWRPEKASELAVAEQRALPFSAGRSLESAVASVAATEPRSAEVAAVEPRSAEVAAAPATGLREEGPATARDGDSAPVSGRATKRPMVSRGEVRSADGNGGEVARGAPGGVTPSAGSSRRGTRPGTARDADSRGGLNPTAMMPTPLGVYASPAGGHN